VSKFPVRFPCARTPDNVRLMVTQRLTLITKIACLGAFGFGFQSPNYKITQLQNS
jgi:hypothetical protein